MKGYVFGALLNQNFKIAENFLDLPLRGLYIFYVIDKTSIASFVFVFFFPKIKFRWNSGKVSGWYYPKCHHGPLGSCIKPT